MMKMERIELILDYLRQLDSLKANGYQCHKEIMACIKEIAKELNLPDVNKVEVPEGKALVNIKGKVKLDCEVNKDIYSYVWKDYEQVVIINPSGHAVPVKVRDVEFIDG
jgi:hypothetical protein